MKLRIVYDGACPFCSDYVRYQRLDRAAESIELIDARTRPEVLAAEGIPRGALEDGMVVIVDGRQHHGADAVHLLSTLSESPESWWVRSVAVVSRSGSAARVLYPVLRMGRRAALALLGIPRFPRD
jgi:predicted DCC family thiol-disulfide oxidoreductase YuxK